MNCKKMNAKQFRKLGLLQEINRCFLHPMGMALEIIIDDETGTERFGDVWLSDDEDGWIYGDNMIQESKSASVLCLMKKIANTRMKKFGFIIQPVNGYPDSPICTECKNIIQG